jgi:hypothetical protein
LHGHGLLRILSLIQDLGEGKKKRDMLIESCQTKIRFGDSCFLCDAQAGWSILFAFTLNTIVFSMKEVKMTFLFFITFSVDIDILQRATIFFL